MDQRINYYVSRKNILTWLAVLSFLASMVLRIRYYEPLELLPIIGIIVLVLILIVNGDEHFYKTAIPVCLFALYFAIKGAQSGIMLRWQLLILVACIGTAFIYYRTSCGKENNWLILIVFIALLAYKVFQVRKHLQLQDFPDILLFFGGVMLMLSLKIHLDGEWHPTWGDRPDGRKLRTLDPITIVATYIMPTRNGASNFIYDKIEITELEKYIVRKRKEGYKGFGITHILLAAYVRCVAKYPALNRFLAGQRVYSRGDDIQFCMVVKSAMTLEGEESILKLHLKPTDTIYDIYDKLDAEIKRIKGTKVGSSDFDKTAKLVSLIPGLVIKFGLWLIRILDYFGLLPKFLLEISPFHASVFFTSMASLGIPPIVHHLYNFGNMPVFCSFGAKYKTNEVDDDGVIHTRRWVDYTFNTDERICDGFYYASVFKYFKKLLLHPEGLEVPPEEVARDID